MYMIKITKKLVFIFLAVVLAVAVLGLWLFDGKKNPSYETVEAKRGDIIQEVSVTGAVKPSQSVDLAFEKGGRIVGIYAEVSDKVKSGQKLMELDTTSLKTQLAKAEAELDSAKAQMIQLQAALNTEKSKLEDLREGSRPEELKIAETAVSNAEQTLKDAEINLANIKLKADIDLNNLYDDVSDVLNDSYAKADDAVNKQIIDLFSENSPNDFKLTFSIYDSSVKNEIEQKRISVKTDVLALKSVAGSSISMNKEDALASAKKNLEAIRDFLAKLNDTVDMETSLISSTVSTYKGYINTGRTNVNTAITNINGKIQVIATQKVLNQQNIITAQTSVNSAKSALASAQDTLALKKAGATQKQIETQLFMVEQANANLSAQAAKIKQAEANVDNYMTQIKDSSIFASFSGMVIKQDRTVGEVVSANIVAVSMIGESGFEVDVQMPEADIVKVAVGQDVKVTLDAYGDDVIFGAKVAFIEPAETAIEGVSTYKTTLQFNEKDDRIKSGMTANADILSGKQENVIVIPQRAVISKDNKKIVQVLSGETVIDKEVTTGLKGSYGDVVILDGIQEGDKVILFTK